MSEPDFREWADARPWGDDWSPHLRQMSDEMAERGATFGRITRIEAYGTSWICVDGWRARPDDQGAEPTDADIPIGFA